MLNKYVEIPHDLHTGIYATGSRVICSPPSMDTDEDYILCTSDLKRLHTFLEENGFKSSIKDQEEYELHGEGFYCYRKGHLNLIVTEDRTFYNNFVKATILAKKMNLLEKEQRIALFKYVLYEEYL